MSKTYYSSTAVALSLLASLSAAPALAQDSASPVVRVAQGQVRGQVVDGIASFKGIPFAAPPVGDLRWRAPRPAALWQGVRDATAFGPECMQPRSSRNDRPQSEDCLSLNVWKPAGVAAGAKLPVMFWIYGGGFTIGSNSNPGYDGTNFARRDVILVNVNYRLGALGFFAHPALTAENPKGDLGNYGLMDVIAGLRWVKQNIAAFGGDPDNITIFGESAGGVLVDLLMTSPRAYPLFNKAIAQSSFASLVHEPIRGDGPRTGENKGLAFARSFGVTGTDAQAAAALRQIPAEKIIAVPNGGRASGTLPTFGPMIDGKLFVERPADVFAAGREAKVPFIIGGTSWESSLMAGVTSNPERTLAKLGPARAAATAAYQGDLPAVVNAIKTDVAVTEPARRMAKLHAAHGQNAYAFYFAYVPEERRPGSFGAPHGSDVPHVFGTLENGALAYPGYPALTITPQSRALSAAMTTYWTNFAKTGEPGTIAGQTWRKVARDNGFMVFDEAGPKYVPHFMETKLDALKDAPNEVRLPIP